MDSRLTPRGLLVVCLVAALSQTVVLGAQIVHLDRLQWGLANANRSISLSTQLPAYPLEVLRAKGIIQDPNWRYGELESRWVAMDTWTFSLKFSGNASGMPELLQKQHILLQLGGIDTFGTVMLNGKQLLKTNNFHRSWAVPVKSVLTAGVNTLTITLRPAAPETLSLKASHPYSIPSLQQLGSIGAYVFARKPASDFGWDWGPAYAASGIHGFVNLLAFDTATLTSAFVAQSQIKSSSGNKFAVNITSQFVVPAAGDRGTLQVEIPALGIKRQEALVLGQTDAKVSKGVKLRQVAGGAIVMAVHNTNLTIDAAAVDLWWPAGYGQQPMYDVLISFTPESMEKACADSSAPGSGKSGVSGGGAVDAGGHPGPTTRKLLDAFVAAAAEEADYKSDSTSLGASGTFVAASGNLPPACAKAVQTISTFRRRIGFRTVELVRLPISKAVQDLFPPGEKGWDTQAGSYQQKDNGDGHWAQTKDGVWKHFAKDGDQSKVDGESFYFKINGVPIYMKGANYIPSHIVHTNASTQMLNDTLQYALESNMNMIRVWGGGRYPVQSLFHFADEHGILIWMETMFACAPYPRDPDFLDNVAAEVTQQLQRTSWHPSVAIWGGNNEIEGSLNWYAESRSNRAMFANDYQALFIDTIRREIRQINPTIPFVDSSPSNGVIADNDREYVKRWGDDWDWRYGDVHWYAYESDCEDWTTYPKSKFISEFGSQSYPTFATYAQATAPEDWQVDNKMTGFRNRRFGNGLEMFEAQFKRHFRLPESWSAPEDPAKALKLFKSFFYITHMQQARCYEAAINYWRRLRSQPAGLTMGVLYWQLNDIAHFASWSSYDYEGRWKPLAYSVKRMYAPLQVQAFQDGKNFKVFLVNDRVTPIATTVTVSVLSLDQNSTSSCPAAQSGAAATHTLGVDPVAKTDFTVPPSFASQVYAAPIDTLLASHPGCTPTSCYISVTAVAKPDAGEWRQAGAGEVSEAQLWLVPLKDIDFPDPGLRLSNFQVGAAAAAAAAATAATAAAPVPGAAAAAAASALPARALLADEEEEEEEEDADDSEQADSDAKAETKADKEGKEQPSKAAGGSKGDGTTKTGSGSSKKTFPRASRAFRSRFSSGAPKPPVPAARNPAKNLRDRLHGGSAPEPSMVPSKVVLPAGTPLSFTMTAQRPAALTQFLTKYRGRFSDDAFTAVHPCQPKTITFYPHVSAGPITAEELAADLKVESLFDHQYGKPAARKVQGGGGVQLPTVAAAPQLPVAVKKVPAKVAAVATANILAVEKKRHAPN